jgi:hypothetical protein
MLMMLNGWSERTSLPAIAAAIAVGMFAWIIGLWRLQHPLHLEIRNLCKRLLPAYFKGA